MLEPDLLGGESLFLFNVRWRSKRGGDSATAGYRRAAAEVLGRRIVDLLRADVAVVVVVAGDLNEPGEAAVGNGALSVRFSALSDGTLLLSPSA